MKKHAKKIRLIGWIIAIILGFLVWQYPEKTSFITINPGGIIVVLIVFYLGLYGLPSSKKSKDKNNE
ncbi:hypothetical protein [Aquibacillus saliphilus]|uniref:hypothetical protein n=1 Tax=Aquibacillus saliphilus TaxID=1909422 RepID=UPI001CEFF061|nr:hypothetical protein [Aquibacillus saliphilus]